MAADALRAFHPVVRDWFTATFTKPSRPQNLGWTAIARGDSTLILAPTGSGKTLAAFLWCLDRLLFAPRPRGAGCRVVYVSPLKALAVDVERNLQRPLDGIAALARDRNVPVRLPTIAVRTGDTPAAARARFSRQPADILITTPESLYLLLTSNARETLRSVETVIVDEIHALVPTKRGVHLAISLERLEALTGRPIQRIGLSATQRPLDEVARFLGGAQPDPDGAGHRPRYRAVTIVDAGTRRALDLHVEAPMVDPASTGGAEARSSWSAIHPRLLELIRAHRSTLIFVNSRRLAERLADALNDLAGETLVRSHHGSLAPPQRLEVESLLKAGQLRALVATSSLELGIDMGAIDLVVQIEAPPSVASGLQRIGRGGHRIDAVSKGVIFPKFRGDLLPCAAVTRAMRDGAVEAVRYPRNTLDIVAQQVVAMVAMDVWRVDDLFATIRRAAPFVELSREAFDGVLDMLSGRYPSDAFAELRPRLTWDRRLGTVTAREGARHTAVVSGGTIPDRGLFGVFLAGAPPGTGRVGELDEEMVFESAPGDVFVLGASSWRIEEITHDRVIVAPAPGEPGRMPFWKGERPGRPFEFGQIIGRLSRKILGMPPPAALARLTRDHDLDDKAAEALVSWLRDQQAATRAVPDDRTIVVERLRDDYGDWRICVLSSRGGRVHAPWAMAAAAHIREATGIDGDVLWSDDGFVIRVADVDTPPDVSLLLPRARGIENLVTSRLGATPLFAARFRENAARSLLLPRRRPGRRAPLWHQRRRSRDLLTVASRFPTFPVLLETYRECLRDIFDIPGLEATLEDIERKRIRVVTVDTTQPSPFAASLLFGYVANFLYEGDAPLAERRAQALAIDQSQLRDLLGDAELRDLLDADTVQELERQLQRLEPRLHARSVDALHDMLLGLGGLTRAEVSARFDGDAGAAIDALVADGRALAVMLAGEERLIAVEDAARLRDALGVELPEGLPGDLLASVADAPGDLAGRYARTHAPFTAAALARRFALSEPEAERLLERLTAEGRLLEGAFTPGVQGREWVDPGVLRQLRWRSLAKVRHEIEPVEPAILGRFTTAWQGITRRRWGRDALLDAIEQLQGAPIVASTLDAEILPARLEGYHPVDLDTLAAAGEIVWVGLEPLGDRDGRIAVYLSSALPVLLPAVDWPSQEQGREAAILEALAARGASFFGPLHEAAGGGYPGETVAALWNLVWRGLVTNDTFHPLRAFTRREPARRASRRAALLRPRQLVPPMAEGRWSLVPGREPSRTRHARSTATPDSTTPPAATALATALTRQLLARHGILTRETMNVEAVSGGFSAVYPVLKAMEDRGQVRRGYFVAGLGAAQFGLPGAVDLLRSLRDPGCADRQPEAVLLAATDPANPYGATLRFPPSPHGTPMRTAGASVILVDGALTAFLSRGDRTLLTWLPDTEPERSRTAGAVAGLLIARARSAPPAADQDREGEDQPRGMLIEEIDGIAATVHPAAPSFIEAGFSPGALGLRATFDER